MELFEYRREWVISTCARAGARVQASTPEHLGNVRFLL